MTVLLFILRQFIICTYHFNHLIMYVVLCFIFVIFFTSTIVQTRINKPVFLRLLFNDRISNKPVY